MKDVYVTTKYVEVPEQGSGGGGYYSVINNTTVSGDFAAKDHTHSFDDINNLDVSGLSDNDFLIYNAATFNYENNPLTVDKLSASGTPGDTEILFNDNNEFGTDSVFTFDKTTDILSVPNLSVDEISEYQFGAGITFNDTVFGTQITIGTAPIYSIMQEDAITVANSTNNDASYVYSSRINTKLNNTYRVDLYPDVSDGASAVAYKFDTSNTLSDAGAKLMSVLNLGSEKFSIGKDGEISGYSLALNAGVTIDTIETTLTDDDTHSPTSGAVVDYVAANAGVGALDELTDTNISSDLSANEIIQWDGTDWVNQTLEEALSAYALLAGRSGDVLNIDEINEYTAGAGISFEQVTIKDGRMEIPNSGSIYFGSALSTYITLDPADYDSLSFIANAKAMAYMDATNNLIKFNYKLALKETNVSVLDTPDTGYGYLVADRDGLLYWKDDAGNVYDLTGTSSGYTGGGGSATPAGTEGDIQYNDGSSGLGAESALNWDSVNNVLSVAGEMRIANGADEFRFRIDTDSNGTYLYVDRTLSSTGFSGTEGTDWETVAQF